MSMNMNMFRAPSNKTEFIQLLDEAIRLADELNAQIDQIGAILEKSCDTCTLD